MSDLFSDYIEVVMSVLLFSALLGFMTLITGNSYEIYNKKDVVEERRETLQWNKQLYSYDNTEMIGDDILVTIQKFSKAFDMEIQLGGTGGSYYKIKKTDSDSVWSVENVRIKLSGNLGRKYLATLIRDTNNIVTGFRFSCID